MKRQPDPTQATRLYRRILVVCVVALVTPASVAQGGVVQANAETLPDAPGLLLAWVGRIADMALCGQTLRVALDIGEAPAPHSRLLCSTTAPSETDETIAGEGHMDGQVRAYTGPALRRHIARCQRELGASPAAEIYATDGVDRVLWSDQGLVVLAQASAGSCEIVQAWRPPADKPRVTQGMFVKTGAYVIVRDDLPGHDDTAPLYYLSEGMAHRVLEHAWQLDGRPQLRNSRMALVVGTSMRVAQDRRDPRLVQHPPPLLAIAQVDGRAVMQTLGDFLQHHDEQVLVRSTQDPYRVAVARLGGLVSSVLVVGAQACGTQIEVVGYRDGTRIEGAVAPRRTWNVCSSEPFILPHR
jgi:hypothetical protein